MLVERILAFLQPAFTLESVFMAVGAADGRLALHAAGYVERVYAVDTVLTGRRRPPNLVEVVSSRFGIPVPRASVDVAFCDDFTQIRQVHAALAPGGVCFCPGGVPELYREAGFSRVRFYVGAFQVPFAIAKYFDYRSAATK